MVCLICFSDALDMIHMEPEPPTTANDSCHMSHDIVWLSGGGEGDFQLLADCAVNQAERFPWVLCLIRKWVNQHTIPRV